MSILRNVEVELRRFRSRVLVASVAVNSIRPPGTQPM
jgi:hypothetical protein